MSSWPHAPSRRGLPPGAYVVTAGTYLKQRLLDSDKKLDLHLDLLHQLALEFGWQLEAWAVLSNHYHFVGHKPEAGASLKEFLGKLHSCSSRELNRLDQLSGRKVWYSYFDKHLTFETSYLARLNYVHNNPVRHQVVEDARAYRWCSAEWFFQRADEPFYKTVSNFKYDEVSMYDDYD
jgi:putative transposase